MAVVIPAASQFATDLDLFSTTDPLLCNALIIVLYGAAASAIVSSSSRIQLHIYTAAGFESYPRLNVSPSSPYYASVKALPREEQGDEVCRGLAFGLAKYFAELPHDIRDTWLNHVYPAKRLPSSNGLFSPTHVAVLASRMTRVDRPQPVIQSLQRTLAEHRVSWLDLDLVLPPDSIKPADTIASSALMSDDDICKARYGKYHFLVSALGEPAFLPTSKMKRAPSKSTSLGRGLTFTRHQKEMVRKEMCELVDTEESYVQKLSLLVQDVANKLRKVQEPQHDQSLVQKLFPPSLDRILALNTALLDLLRTVLDSTEESAIAAIKQDARVNTTAADDSIGILKFARSLLEHLPAFSDDYCHFMAGHAQYPALTKQLSKSTNATIKDAVHHYGEQRLTSTLIEPVQRLPRYALYIDTITKQLPNAHPALQVLLKARDIVSEICSRDDREKIQPTMEKRLGHLVQSWPEDIARLGRLVTIVDAAFLKAPFEQPAADNIPSIILLFTNSLVVLERLHGSAPNARSLQTELQNITAQDILRSLQTPSLRVIDLFDLHNISFTEFLDDTAIAITRRRQLSDLETSSAPCVLALKGTYDGKMSRFAEDVVKARIEGRFEEAERTNGRWDVRSAVTAQDEPNIFTAVFDSSDAKRDRVGAIRLVVEPDQHIALTKPGVKGLDFLINIASAADGQWQITVKDKSGLIAREKMLSTEVGSVLSRRLTSLLQSRSSIRDPAIMAALIAQNDQILQSFCAFTTTPTLGKSTFSSPALSEPDSDHRPHSPVKALSAFLSSIGPGAAHGPSRKSPAPDTSQNTSPDLRYPMSSTTSRAPSVESRPSTRDESALPIRRPTVVEKSSRLFIDGSTKRMGEVLSTYLLALQARQGNVAKIIKMRGNADRDAVNVLYETILQEPSLMVVAAQAPVDVLFCSFERFLSQAWSEQFGPVIDLCLLKEIQEKADQLRGSDFQRYLRGLFANLTLPSQRALKGIIHLFTGLLNGIANEGDRGALTAAFAELLAPKHDPHKLIFLVDRCVKDFDSLFSDVVHACEVDTRLESGMLPTDRMRGSHTGSLTSSSSSLRKKFGFGGLSRDNSVRENRRPDQESRVGSVWRTISKSKHGSEMQTGMTRATVQRAKSTDVDTRFTPKQSAPQEQAKALGPFPFERPRSKELVTFMQSPPLDTIGESGKGNPARKKRRSSLSDVPNSVESSQDVKRVDPGQNGAPSVSGIDVSLTPSGKQSLPSRLPSLRRGISTGIVQTAGSTPKPDEVVITSHTPSRGSVTVARGTAGTNEKRMSGVPIRAGLSERPSSGNAMKIKPTASPDKTEKTVLPSTRKLKMQSPQKLRERLQQEQRDISRAQTSLQDEMAKLGEELSNLGSGRNESIRHTNAEPRILLDQMAAQLTSLQETMDTTLGELGARTAVMQADFTSSLTVSENRSKNLDSLYREANAENEALYARFNDELGKVVKGVRGGEGVEELKRTIKEGNEERDRLRRENARLKREVVGLKSQLRN